MCFNSAQDLTALIFVFWEVLNRYHSVVFLPLESSLLDCHCSPFQSYYRSGISHPLISICQFCSSSFFTSFSLLLLTPPGVLKKAFEELLISPPSTIARYTQLVWTYAFYRTNSIVFLVFTIFLQLLSSLTMALITCKTLSMLSMLGVR